MTETTLLRHLLITTSQAGQRLFRNQVGRYRLALPSCRHCQEHGRMIVSGLCVGSSDLIGWTPIVIGPEHVGRTLAVFTAIECKVGRNTTTAEQDAFLRAVIAAGGIAAVARSEDDVRTAIAVVE